MRKVTELLTVMSLQKLNDVNHQLYDMELGKAEDDFEEPTSVGFSFFYKKDKVGSLIQQFR